MTYTGWECHAWWNFKTGQGGNISTMVVIWLSMHHYGLDTWMPFLHWIFCCHLAGYILQIRHGQQTWKLFCLYYFGCLHIHIQIYSQMFVYKFCVVIHFWAENRQRNKKKRLICKLWGKQTKDYLLLCSSNFTSKVFYDLLSAWNLHRHLNPKFPCTVHAHSIAPVYGYLVQ